MIVDTDDMLSPHFSMAELTRSQTAKRHQLYNIPRDVSEVANLKALCERVLEPVRAMFGKPVIITSGYRCGTVNRLIGGSVRSQHMLGEAADFIIPGLAPYDAAYSLAARADVPFDQLIFENRQAASGWRQWIHISHKRLGGNRGEVLTMVLKDGEKITREGVHQPEALSQAPLSPQT